MDYSMFLTILVTLITIAYIFIRKRYSFWSDRGFVQAQPNFPFGNIMGIGFKKHKSIIMTELYNEHKHKSPVLGIYFFTSPTILAMDLDIIKHFLVKDFGTFHDRGFYSNAKVDPLSANLFTLVGQEWRDFRTKLTSSFTSGKIKLMFETVVEVSKNMIDALKCNASDEIEMKGLLADFTTDVIGKVAFGLDINSIKEPNNMFRTMGAKVFKTRPLRIIKIFFMISFKNLATKLNLRFHDKDVSDFFINSIEQTLNYRKENNVVRPDFINLLMQIKDKNGDPLSRDEMAAHSFLWYLAGFETSSTTITFCLYELALNVDVQDKLRNEINDLLKKHNDVLSYDAMQEMKYLQMVVDETLRKFGVVDNLIRVAASDYTVPDTKLVIPKGTIVFIPAYSIHNDEDIYPNPSKFDPERFNEGNKKSRHPMAYMPFGDGPRSCIGLRFGVMQTKVGLIQLLTNFKFTPCSKTTIPMKFVPNAPLLSPYNDMWLKVENL